jgi:predicted dehydrogenase
MRPVKFGILSTAKIARDWVIPAIKAVPECDVIAICSREPMRARDVAAKFGIRTHFASLAEMLTNTDVEVVYIPTPNSCHVDDAIEVLRAGRHVLCEKPIGLNAREAARLLAVQQETGLIVSETLMVRYHPRWIAAREVIRSGRLGRITQIHATYSVMNQTPGDIRFQRELGGGALGDVGIYPITAARFLFEAEPIAVTAMFEPLPGGDIEAAAAGMLEFAGHRYLLFSAALRQAWAHWIMVLGTEGWMELPLAVWPSAEQETVIRIYGRDDLNDTAVETLRFSPANQYEHEVRAFARAVRGESSDLWPLSDAVAGMRILDAVRISAARGQRIPISSAYFS